jgi:hypothetical protein
MNNNIVVLEDGVNLLKTGEYPESIMYKGNQYKYFDSGGSGKIYKDEEDKYILKILYSDILSYKYFKAKCEDEITNQRLAAEHQLAPQLEYSFIKISNGHICCMKMKYLKNHIDLYDTDKLKHYNNLICHFIKSLIDIGLFNITDPTRHFYLDVDNKIKMIDYGSVKYIQNIKEEEKIKLMNLMAKLCGVTCNFVTKKLPKKLPKKVTIGRPTAGKGSTITGSKKRGSTKRGSTKRGSKKRGSKKRGSQRAV